MELILFLVALAIVGIILYQLSPNTKFAKANTLYNADKYDEAIEILNAIFEKHPDAPATLAACKLQQAIKAKETSVAVGYYNDVLEIRKRLTTKTAIEKYELAEANAFLGIANLNFYRIIAITNAETKIKSLKENLLFIENAAKLGVEEEFQELKGKHFAELSDIYFSFGLKSEKADKLEDAIRQYSSAKNFAEKASFLNRIYDVEARIGICRIKNKEKLSEVKVENIKNGSFEYKRDFFFRYSTSLIKENEHLKAEMIIADHINFSDPVIKQLKEVIKAKKTKEAHRKIKEINYQLDQLYENSFPVNDVKNLYETIDLKTEEISSVIPNIASKLKDLKPSLFNKLLTHYISIQEFEKAIILIQKFPAFWETPLLLKNLGICCFGFAANGGLTEKNYRTIISCWLTAVYSDKVILKTMEETIWDDEYTFTLVDSIGSNYSYHTELPENVNYDETSEANISIGATQRELLAQFETVINKTIADSSFLQTVNDFYLEEKENVQQIISVLNCDILFAAPHFAKLYGINNTILMELNNDYEKYDEEAALKAGIPYLKNKGDNHVSIYSTAKELFSNLLAAILSENLNEVKSIIADKRMRLIQNYDSINDLVEDSIYNTFLIKIKNNDENENLIPLMKETIRFTENNEKLKFQYAMYVADFCIAKVNAKKINNLKALHFIQDAYFCLPDNERICKNFVTLIRNNLMDILNGRTTQPSPIYSMLKEIPSKRSRTFIEHAVELHNERIEILQQLQDSGTNIASLTGAYGYNLTPEGENLKKALDYMKELSAD